MVESRSLQLDVFLRWVSYGIARRGRRTERGEGGVDSLRFCKNITIGGGALHLEAEHRSLHLAVFLCRGFIKARLRGGEGGGAWSGNIPLQKKLSHRFMGQATYEALRGTTVNKGKYCYYGGPQLIGPMVNIKKYIFNHFY